MSEDLRQDVRDLCSAVREVLSVFDLQQAQTEAARERAEASRAALDRWMERNRTGGERPTGAERSQSLLAALGSAASSEAARADFQTIAELGRRWERGFCTIYETLIRLNAHAEARLAVAGLAERVRVIRLLEMEPEDAESVPPLAPARGPGGGGFSGRISLDDFDGDDAERMNSFLNGLDLNRRAGAEPPATGAQRIRRHLQDLLVAAEALRPDR